jgi:hypothetical protein
MVALSYTTAFSSPLAATTTTVIDPVYDWTEYLTVDGIKIEYKYQAFESGPFRNQLIILFKYTNTSTDSKSITWATEEYRDEVCTNCNQINDSEYTRTVSLVPGEVLEGKALDASKTEEYLFSNFIKLVPGMTNQRLTDFELVNINVSTL